LSGRICQHAVRRPLGGSPGWFRCGDCGIWMRDPMPTSKELDAFYAAAYDSGTLQSSASMHATNAALARQYLRLVERAIPSLRWKKLKILEYGAGEGDLAQELAARGANVVAVEPYGLEVCKARGLAAFRSLDDLPAEGVFDGIMMTEVAEHMRSPSQTFSRLQTLLKKDGWLFVTTPNNSSLRARLLQGRWSECAKLGHLFLFSRGALTQALESAGFQKAVAIRATVRFSDRLSKLLSQYLLQILALDGQLRYIALKARDVR
jgi:SAM-dependent methyltransferase